MLAESSLASSLLALERQLDRTQQVAAIAAAVVDDADAAHETAQQRLHANARAAPPGVLHALDQLMQGARRCHRELDGSLANVEVREPVLPQVQQRVVATPALPVDARMVALQQTDEALRVGVCLHARQLLRRLADDCDLKAAPAL